MKLTLAEVTSMLLSSGDFSPEFIITFLRAFEALGMSSMDSLSVEGWGLLAAPIVWQLAGQSGIDPTNSSTVDEWQTILEARSLKMDTRLALLGNETIGVIRRMGSAIPK